MIVSNHNDNNDFMFDNNVCYQVNFENENLKKVDMIIDKILERRRLLDEIDYDEKDYYNPKKFMLKVDHHIIGKNSDKETWITIDDMNYKRNLATDIYSFGLSAVIRYVVRLSY